MPVRPPIIDDVDDKNQRETRTAIQQLSTTLSNGRFLGRRVLTASGIYTPTKGAVFAWVQAIGGGGGGGGAGLAAANVSVGGGGSSGALLDIVIGTKDMPLSGGAFSCGAGGAGGANTGGNGASGSDTTFSLNGVTYTAKGGLGGSGGTGTTSGFSSPGGLANSPSYPGGFVTQEPGQPGIVTSAILGWGGSGGSTPLGAGAQTAGAGASFAGGQFGSGGSGACTIGAGIVGGGGFAGCIVIWEST